MTGTNVHGTAIVIGTTGLLFVGPSGSGKSSTALDCLFAARDLGIFAALVSDDQVLISRFGDRIVVRAPAATSGLIEIRGSGIFGIQYLEAAVLKRAIAPVNAPFEERLPPEAEDWSCGEDFSLPLLRLPYGDGTNPFNRLRVILPEIGGI